MMRRAIAVARDYASRRKAFGKYIKDHTLFQTTLATMEIQFRGNLLLVLHAVNLL
jgi:acyl-CoA dehydrogenase